MKKLLVLLVNIFLSYILFSKNVVINGTILNIEIAESSSERAKGLMNRDFLECRADSIAVEAKRSGAR